MVFSEGSGRENPQFLPARAGPGEGECGSSAAPAGPAVRFSSGRPVSPRAVPSGSPVVTLVVGLVRSCRSSEILKTLLLNSSFDTFIHLFCQQTECPA